ncbi:MAG: discoidin domain-containing protein [Phycisphaeraceae bacterium]
MSHTMSHSRRPTRFVITSLILAFFAAHGVTAEPASRLRLELEFIDGSRLFGEPAEADPTIGLRSRVGDVKVPLAELARIDVHQDQETVAIQWPNGDQLTGVAATAGFVVNTVLGKLHIPLATLRRCTVQVIAADKALKPAGVSASGAWSHQVAANVMDGNLQSVWSSGAYSGWIEVDLGANYELASIRTLIQCGAAGSASHAFYVSDKPMRDKVAGGRLVQSFSGSRHDDEWLASDCERGTAGRYVQVRCTSSRDWFNLKEIEVMPRL